MNRTLIAILLGVLPLPSFAVVIGSPTGVRTGNSFGCFIRTSDGPCAPDDYNVRFSTYSDWSARFDQSRCEAEQGMALARLHAAETALKHPDAFEFAPVINENAASPAIDTENIEEKKLAERSNWKVKTCGYEVKSRDPKVYLTGPARPEIYFRSSNFLKTKDYDDNGRPIVCVEKRAEALKDPLNLVSLVNNDGTILQGGFCAVWTFPIKVVAD